ncbi:MAG: hypothetical protein B7Z63_05465 [Ignavibacteriae bacterium 37-53-5]|nr:MAG: hypothetical protein B7Z63_05465 [Ignavibacteriae bacterium 37-53-5]
MEKLSSIPSEKKRVQKKQIENPLSDLLSDDVYEKLIENSLLDYKAVRDYQIKRRFKDLRNYMSVGDAIEKIQDEYPYLRFDTIRKIVYNAKAEKE